MVELQIELISGHIETLFKYYDKASNGTLSSQEIEQILKEICLPFRSNYSPFVRSFSLPILHLKCTLEPVRK